MGDVAVPPGRKVLVCFDYEGSHGMPFVAPYDLPASTERILETLRHHGTHAVFFVVGVLARDHPDLIARIAAEGHEIALHGWRHEHLDRLTQRELEEFARGLKEAEAAVQASTGRTPVGFRAPYLLGPRFYDAGVYELLAGLGYRWVSNRELRYVVQLLRPDRLRTGRPWRLAESRGSTFTGHTADLMSLALNADVWTNHGLGGSRTWAVRWLRSGCPPFYRGRLLEIPVYSPLDCDLVGLPYPSEPTDTALLDFASYALVSTLAGTGPVAMLTFHDWIVSGANRLSLLDRVLSAISSADATAVTVEECWAELTACAVSPTAAGAGGLA